MNGRRRMLAALGIGAMAAVALRPGTRGAPHDGYFRQMADALRQAGIATPTLVLDRRRLQDNVGRVMAHLAGRIPLRLVVKSLPCPALLNEAAALCGTRRQMLFSLPQLLAMARGDRDILLGKPLPVAAAQAFYHRFADADFHPERQLQWLVDTPERLAQYRELARGQNLRLRVNLEIDVGLHRGGVADAATMAAMLDLLESEPRLQWSGLMGYDAHVAKIPDLPGLRERAHRHAREAYAAFAAMARARPALYAAAGRPCFNAGGSPTYRLYHGDGVENEVALGSALLKPGDFDTALLDDLRPACFIATPVLKALPDFQLPYGVEWLGGLARGWDPNARRAYFIYGGNWLADPVSPPGLSASGLYGVSSNQQVLLGSGLQRLAADDMVFFRPRQSEAVLQQFGDIAVYQDGRIVDSWPVLPATG
ncbi:DSD1 family PLP-dependent enzyme [Chromobacterium sp. ATCC 53434]|uniref:DSD1 family PLP-dependent enzyme n=1 Tax=Chromobacterium sp. (strain ATCC 53434 / SC 14030) TaxID=2059672 RepID=UPI001F47FF69|nr:DSD1 family PLP-dependent enzyme [Chromobacterium sp. ATCC 53434]